MNRDLEENLEKHTTENLIYILKEKDTNIWREEVFVIIEKILEKRLNKNIDEVKEILNKNEDNYTINSPIDNKTIEYLSFIPVSNKFWYKLYKILNDILIFTTLISFAYIFEMMKYLSEKIKQVNSIKEIIFYLFIIILPFFIIIFIKSIMELKIFFILKVGDYLRLVLNNSINYDRLLKLSYKIYANKENNFSANLAKIISIFIINERLSNEKKDHLIKEGIELSLKMEALGYHYPFIYWSLGQFYKFIDNYKEAILYFEKYLELNNNDLYISETIKILKVQI